MFEYLKNAQTLGQFWKPLYESGREMNGKQLSKWIKDSSNWLLCSLTYATHQQHSKQWWTTSSSPWSKENWWLSIWMTFSCLPEQKKSLHGSQEWYWRNYGKTMCSWKPRNVNSTRPRSNIQAWSSKKEESSWTPSNLEVLETGQSLLWWNKYNLSWDLETSTGSSYPIIPILVDLSMTWQRRKRNLNGPLNVKKHLTPWNNNLLRNWYCWCPTNQKCSKLKLMHQKWQLEQCLPNWTHMVTDTL